MKPRVVLVTGASRGIGRAIALAFANQGALVGVHYHRAEEAAQETRQALPGEGHALLQANLSCQEQAAALIPQTIRAFGRLDVLVNNAGIYQSHSPTSSDAEQWQTAWQQTIATNLMAPAYLCHQAVQHMLDAGGGRIINITSRGAFRGEPDAPAYGASKAGLNALSQSLAKALAPHRIFVYAIAPGWVATDMAAPHLEGEAGRRLQEGIPLGRVAEPEEIARAAVFLAGEGTESMTGCILDVNGASYLRT
ncbi:MAG: SDR family oxidoreductase [Deltaproteobacteria bacterium]|nr:SDR family oxidoreductase [Deltaproteobacteria bacterium]